MAITANSGAVSAYSGYSPPTINGQNAYDLQSQQAATSNEAQRQSQQAALARRMAAQGLSGSGIEEKGIRNTDVAAETANAQQQGAIQQTELTQAEADQQAALQRAAQEQLQSESIAAQEQMQQAGFGSQSALQTQEIGAQEQMQQAGFGSQASLQAAQLASQAALQGQEIGAQETMQGTQIGATAALQTQQIASTEKIQADAQAIQQQGMTIEQAQLEGYTDANGNHVAGTAEIQAAGLTIEEAQTEGYYTDSTGHVVPAGTPGAKYVPGTLAIQSQAQQTTQQNAQGYFTDASGNTVSAGTPGAVYHAGTLVQGQESILAAVGYSVDANGNIVPAGTPGSTAIPGTISTTADVNEAVTQTNDLITATAKSYYDQGQAKIVIDPATLANLQQTDPISYQSYEDGLAGRSLTEWQNGVTQALNYQSTLLTSEDYKTDPNFSANVNSIFQATSNGTISDLTPNAAGILVSATDSSGGTPSAYTQNSNVPQNENLTTFSGLPLGTTEFDPTTGITTSVNDYTDLVPDNLTLPTGMTIPKGANQQMIAVFDSTGTQYVKHMLDDGTIFYTNQAGAYYKPTMGPNGAVFELWTTGTQLT
jgi:hypothetical protein